MGETLTFIAAMVLWWTLISAANSFVLPCYCELVERLFETLGGINLRLRLAILVYGIIMSWIPFSQGAQAEEKRQFTFSWPYIVDGKMSPRGGNTVGAPLKLSDRPSVNWTKLKDSSVSKKQKDRLAILAMQGPYRASFDFLESVGYQNDYTPPRPYQSWGTEYVYVIEDDEDFISLQHILVMFMSNEKQEIQGPFVIKHWRQDWKFENSRLIEYMGQDTWGARQLKKSEVAGTWTQAVFQVDDSPRYESFGNWEGRPLLVVFKTTGPCPWQ